MIKPAPGKVTDAAGAVGYVVAHHKNNDAFIAVNRLLKANEEAFFVGDRRYQSADGTGVIFITAKPTTKAILREGRRRSRPQLHRGHARVPPARCTS